jgi:hypothetical protein
MAEISNSLGMSITLSSIPTLQEVTESGYFTNIGLVVSNDTDTSSIFADQIAVTDVAGRFSQITAHGVVIGTNELLNAAIIKSDEVTTERIFQLPDTNGTIALISDIEAIDFSDYASELDFQGHVSNTSNPHSVNKAQIGLSNVDNTSDTNKPVSTLQATAIAVVQADINSHELLTNNPHSVTKTQIGLSNVDNTSDVNKSVSTLQAAAIAIVQGDIDTHEALTNNPHSVTAAQVGAVALNGAITGATKTKITYDSKGLVTSGADATTTDISEGSNLYYTNIRGISSTLTGYSSGAGVISSADTVLGAIQKLNGNIAANVISIGTNTTNIAANTSAIALKANIASPTFTGVPAVPTAAVGTNTTQAASTAFVTAAVTAASSTIKTLTIDQSTTLATAVNITDLVYTMVANAKYIVRGQVYHTGSGTGGQVFGFNLPASTTMLVSTLGRTTSNSTVGWFRLTVSGGFNTATNLTPTGGCVQEISGTVTTGATAGDLQMIFASGVAGQTSTLYAEGTYLEIIRVY